jgi:hypothetical protein
MEELADIVETLSGLRLSLRQRHDPGWASPGFVHIEFVGMTDHIRDSFHDLLLSDSGYGPSTPSRGASHDPTKECFMASTPKVRSLIVDDPVGMPPSVTARTLVAAPLHFAQSHREPPRAQSSTRDSQCFLTND